VRTFSVSNTRRQEYRKFFNLYKGPYIITEIVTHNVYALADPVTRIRKGQFNVIHLRKFFY
jgi:hypothetical protein